MSEPKPTNYYQGQSVSDFIVLHAMPWHLANVVKYLTRWWAKDDMTALYKARDYLDTFIERCETQPATKAFIVAGIKATIEARRAAKVKPEEDGDILSSPVPGFDVDGNMVCVIRCTKCGDQLQARTQPGWRIGISDKWEHRCGEGGEWYTANDFWPIGISAEATRPPTEDEIMGAEFDSLKPGDVIIGEGGMRQVTAVNQESRVITYAYFGANCPLSRTDFIRWCWRKVVTS